MSDTGRESGGSHVKPSLSRPLTPVGGSNGDYRFVFFFSFLRLIIRSD